MCDINFELLLINFQKKFAQLKLYAYLCIVKTTQRISVTPNNFVLINKRKYM